MPTTDFAVIGAGVQGASLAFHLQKSGAGSVTLFERDHPASGASGRSGALVRMYYDNPVESKLAFEGYQFFSNWDEVVGGSCGFRRVGVLWFKPPERLDQLHASVAAQQAIGINTSVITPDRILELFPFVSVEGVGGASYEPDSGFADPSDTTAGLVNAARDLGATVRMSTRVTSLVREGDRVTGFDVDGERWSAGVTIVAAGAWTQALCATANVFVPVRPHRLGAGHVQRPPDLGVHPVIIDETLPLYFRPDTGDRSLIGVEIEPDPYGYEPDAFWPPPQPASLVEVTALAAKRIPAYERAIMGRTWCGLDGFTPDNQQIIGAVPGVEGLHLLCGGNGHGFKVGPAVGKALAEIITGGSTEVADMSQFEIARFGGATEFASWPGLYGD